MASVLGMLEEREAAARVRVRVRVHDLREEVARLAEALEVAEIELDRRVIAREELVEALAASAAEATAVSESLAEAEQETGPLPAPVPGSTVPPWRDGLPVTVLAPDYQRILGVLEERAPAGQGPLKAKEIAVGLALATMPAKVGGCTRRPGVWRSAGGCGRRRRGHSVPAGRGRARRRLIRVTMDHRIIASLVAGSVSSSRARRREFINHANVHSATQRPAGGIPAHPVRMISRVAVHMREAITR
ncbi:hypothetical protein [Streptomyces sp. NPDC058291]|uniref:hypothetical protein n=1 Tax=Streptomyces sp. NPDC058291 TaxID=3346427 RepID=UPI0036E5A6FC